MIIAILMDAKQIDSADLLSNFFSGFVWFVGTVCAADYRVGKWLIVCMIV